ncbi:YcaO-like family protein [Hartmannibacter diazotrophicus]|uniref:YcaO-like family protein n=1 Tax=Hartmannibacter diazotrophicus TaxID=1482074 RepID=UPI0012FD0AFC|nr:YcaO-like family protein [Hartmannibacter diazotrophicus]
MGFGLPLPPGDRQILQLLALFDLEVEIIPLFGLYLATTNLADPSGPITASGFGFDPPTAIRRCLGECAEIVSSRFDAQTDRSRIVSSTHGPRLDIQQCLGFSLRQRHHREDFDRLCAGHDSLPPDAIMDETGHWCQVERLGDGAPAFVPAFCLFSNFGLAVLGEPNTAADSNGLAAGTSPDDAALRAVAELVERDAAGRWWWSQRQCAALMPEAGEGAFIEHLARHEAETGRRSWFLHLGSLAGLHAVAGISAELDGGRVSVGLGCADDPAKAKEKAFLESVQHDLAIRGAELRAARGGPLSARDRLLMQWGASATTATMPHLLPAGVTTIGERNVTKEDLAVPSPSTAAAALEAIGIDVFIFRLTRPDIGIDVVRAIAPGLAHYKPRFGSMRLLDVASEGNLTERLAAGWPLLTI